MLAAERASIRRRTHVARSAVAPARRSLAPGIADAPFARSRAPRLSTAQSNRLRRKIRVFHTGVQEGERTEELGRQPELVAPPIAQQDVPFGAGRLCVGGQILRIGTPVLVEAFHASMTLDFTAPPFQSGVGLVSPGDTRYFQFWFRSPPTFDLTRALEVTFGI